MFNDLCNPVLLMDMASYSKQDSSLDTDLSDLQLNLESFEYDEDNHKAGIMTLALKNPDHMYDDDPRFQGGGKVIRARWGYPTQLSPLKTCMIREASPDYNVDGTSFQIVAWDTASVGFHNANPRNWGKVSTSTIAKQVAYNYGLRALVPYDSDDVRRKPYLQPGKMTDLQYLRMLAKQRGWDCFTDGLNLYYGPNHYDASPALSAVYGGAQYQTSGVPLVLTEFKPNLDQLASPDSRLSGIDTAKKDVATAKTNNQDSQANLPERQALGGRATVSFSDRSLQLSHLDPVAADASAASVKPTTETNPAQMKKDAQASQWRINRLASTANATFTPGSPEVRVYRIVNVQGVGATYAGKWKITSARHTINPSGYSVSAVLSRPGKGADAPQQGTGDKGANNTNVNNKQTTDQTNQASKVSYFQANFATRNTQVVVKDSTQQ